MGRRIKEHYCPENNDLLINNAMPEFKGCTHYKDGDHWVLFGATDRRKSQQRKGERRVSTNDSRAL